MDLQKINYAPLSQGGDDGTAAFLKLEENFNRVNAAFNDPRFTLLAQNWTLRNQLLNADFYWNQRLFGGGAQSTGFNYDMWFDDGSHGSLTRNSATKVVTLSAGATSQCIVGGGDRNAGQACSIGVESPSGPITVTMTPTSGTPVNLVIPAGAGRQAITFNAPTNWAGNLKVKLSSASMVTFRRVQFEQGNPTPYEDRLPQVERFLLQAYWRSTFSYGSAVANNQLGKVIQGVAYGPNAIVAAFDFDQPMAATPAVTFFAPNATSPVVNGQWQALVSGWVNTSSLAVYRANEKGFAVTCNVASGVASFNAVYLQGNYTAAVEITS